jgi:hypothetical protein
VLGGVTEWLMVADCKSAGLTPYVGSNPTPTIGSGAAGQMGGGAVIERVGVDHTRRSRPPRSPADRCPADDAGVAQLVEHQPSKLRVAGSSPVARLWERGNEAARVAQLVERILGKDEVRGSIPRASLLN